MQGPAAPMKASCWRPAALEAHGKRKRRPLASEQQAGITAMKLRGGQAARATEGEESLSAQDGEPELRTRSLSVKPVPRAHGIRALRRTQATIDCKRPSSVVQTDRRPKRLPRHGLAAQDSSMFQNILPLERTNQRHSASAESCLHVPRPGEQKQSP